MGGREYKWLVDVLILQYRLISDFAHLSNPNIVLDRD